MQISQIATQARPARAAGVYRALQVFTLIGSQIPFALTLYALHAHLATEVNPFTAALFALPHGALVVFALRLGLALSILAQSVYCWRRADHAPDSRDILIAGWVSLVAWTALVSVDTLHDASVLLMLR